MGSVSMNTKNKTIYPTIDPSEMGIEVVSSNKNSQLKALKWAYGVITVPERSEDLFQRTLASLKLAGFDNPDIFVDSNPKLGVVGRWTLALHELWVKYPGYHRYAIFQDDLVCVKNLREYIDKTLTYTIFPERAYLNLFTFLSNEMLVEAGHKGWNESVLLRSNDTTQRLQTGHGGLGLVFNREGALTLLTSLSLWNKHHDVSGRAKHNLDGAIVTAMNLAGWREYIHCPSLLQHTGVTNSIIAKSNPTHLPLPLAKSFPGEDYDALCLLEETDRHSSAPTTLTNLLLGDMVESALTKVGITKDRVEKWLGMPCGCTERRNKLNSLHSWARQLFKGGAKREHLESIIGDK